LKYVVQARRPNTNDYRLQVLMALNCVPLFVEYKALRRSTAGNMLPLWIVVEFTDQC
jgi:hypothetical protein